MALLTICCKADFDLRDDGDTICPIFNELCKKCGKLTDVQWFEEEEKKCGKELPDGSICGVVLDCHHQEI